jgi:Secretion system C-terminal sorting domain
MKKMFTLLSALFIGAMATAQVTVTFQVDVTNYVAGGATLDATGMRVAGNFSGRQGTVGGTAMADWSPTALTSEMTDLGNNIWEIAVDFPAAVFGDTLLYKFVNGNWGINSNEGNAALENCGVEDGFEGFNRVLAIPSTNQIKLYCYDSCYSCTGSGVGLNQNAITSLEVAPNPSMDVVTFKFNSNANTAEIVLFDLSGKVVATKSVVTGAENSIEISTANLMAGSYLYQVNAAGNVVTGKLMKK